MVEKLEVEEKEEEDNNSLQFEAQQWIIEKY